MQIGYLGLGSNVGDTRGQLQGAVDALVAGGIEVLASSSTYTTEPVGEILDQPDFLNAAIRIATEFHPEELLEICKVVEAEAGRDLAAIRHSPRPIDVDLLLLGDEPYESDRLRLPHREVTSRRFVLVPLLELDPELVTPDGIALRDALAALGPGQDVALAGPPLDIGG